MRTVLITGSCDREAAVSGASISGSQVSGAATTVKLSSGGQLHLQRVRRWLVVNIDDATHPPKRAHGGCAQRVTARPVSKPSVARICSIT
jgi:hypothetical protein